MLTKILIYVNILFQKFDDSIDLPHQASIPGHQKDSKGKKQSSSYDQFDYDNDDS